MRTSRLKTNHNLEWLILILSVFLCANCAGATTLNVPVQYTTIRAAVDAAVSGDIVQIADGTYSGAENTDIELLDKDIIIQGNPENPASCVIDCSLHGSYRGFVYGYAITSLSRLEGITIRGSNQGSGAGLIAYGNPEIANCIFADNSADYGAAMMIFGSPVISNCKFSNNTAIWGAGTIIRDGSPVFDLCIFTSNQATSSGGGICVKGGTPTLSNCSFSDNNADMGAGVYMDNGYTTLSNCIFYDNSAGWGGGIYGENGSQVAAINCSFTGNTAAGDGGAIQPGVAVFLGGSTADLTNCILWDDTGGEISLYGTNTIKVSHSIVQGGYTGNGNINADPLFADVSIGDLRLKAKSPCIDAGDNSVVNAPPFKLVDGKIVDLDGSPRISNNTVDIGAYETINVNTTPPVITLPANMTVAAAGTSGTVVKYSVTAIDDLDGNVAVTCSPASGTKLPLGVTTVNCTATDSNGNTTTASFTVTVRYTFKGFLCPIKSNGSSFKQGSILPVRFQLPNPKGGFISDATARIYVTKLSNSTCANKTNITPACQTGKGNLFYYERISKQYIFLLNTNSMSTGTWQIGVDLGDGNLNNTATITITRGCGRH